MSVEFGADIERIDFVHRARCGKVADLVLSSKLLLMQPSFLPQTAISQHSKNVALLVYLFTLFFSVIPGLVVYVFFRDDAFVLSTGKEALNWSITMLLCSFVLSLIPFVGWLLAGVLYCIHVICCILGAINARKGWLYRFPFALRLIA